MDMWGGKPLRLFDPKGLVEWSGTVFSSSLEIGAFEIYTLHANCKDGGTAYARGFIVGFGLPAAMSGGTVSLEDGQSDADPDALNGAYKKFSYAYGWGIGRGGTMIQLGQARTSFSSLKPSLFGGVDISITGTAGRSIVVSKEKCKCES